MLIGVAMNSDRLARPLHTFTRRGPTRTVDVDGWTLLRDFPTVLFGDGGSLKSFLALYVAGRLAQQGTRVLLLDWELDGEDHRERLHGLFGSDVPNDVFYLRAEGSLVSEVNVLAREVQRHGIQYLVCDSVGMATEGPPDSSDAALSYFRALRQLGVRGSLGIAHVTKSGDAADQRPFGSVYWQLLPTNVETRVADLRRALRGVDSKIQNLTLAIEQGGANLPSIIALLSERQKERDALVGEIGSAETLHQIHVDRVAIETEVQSKIANWRELVAGSVSDGRQLLREVLEAPLRFTPDGKTYRFTAPIATGKLIAGVVLPTNMASPPGFEPGFQP
jgi:hypothetical protein